MAQRQGNLFIISSPSGAGKSSLIASLLKEHTDMMVSVSHTTRDPRPGEEDGVHYHFVTKDAFETLIGKGDFLEWAQVFENYYGTSKQAIEAKLAEGIDVFLDIDWQGARQVRELLPSVTSIFILPPSREELERRLHGRGQDSVEVINKRMAQAQSESSHYNEYDYVILNDDFDTALGELTTIIKAKRLTAENQSIQHADILSALLN